MEENRLTFEDAYTRLESILTELGSEQVSLDDALTLYEEADKLIGSCQTRLTEAEQKIEILLKNRDGTVTAEPFSPPQQSALQN